MPKITKTALAELVPNPDREINIWDSSLIGFGVRMLPSGKANYFAKYRTLEGQSRKMSLGRVGTLTPDEARKLAAASLGEVAKGGDPSNDRQSKRAAMTVRELAESYIIEGRKRWKKNTFLSNESQIRVHILPLIGDRKVESLRYVDVTKMQADITSGKTAKMREGRAGVTTGGAGVARRSVVLLGAMLNHAMNLDVVERNVAAKVKKTPAGKRTRNLSFEELRILGSVLDDSPEESDVAIAAIRFLLLTGMRRNEALSLEHIFCNSSCGTIELPDTKTGEQVRAVGQAAFRVLPSFQKEWCFPALRGEGHFVGLPKVLKRICAKAGIQGVTPHTLRHTFASIAATMDFSELTIAGLLGHGSHTITSRYAHVADRSLVMAANLVSDCIEKSLAGVKVEDELYDTRCV
ncbi:tyrosine-type recombinase/integrase [Xinfangfangia sp. CPCC 101601]|uniref:Tyrosine-type recombinase/integrase n=1 Tax=Pseudogemmobacter lacusdianii TaxID=3069608 RepID=A0ABU0VU96_9RHOB|nr:site-specific integrase [Xinfangfangia sp. CPCC 101601]MDQ2065228.1 tyrosine-type recombinase/integrase [Xinfangfangia sp. CPCC 101601]